MSIRVDVGKVGCVGRSRPTVVYAADRRIAVFDDAGTLRALDDRCTHAGAPLSEGRCEDGVVTCPWHGARFQLADGRGRGTHPYRRLETFPVEVVDGRVVVVVPDPGF